MRHEQIQTNLKAHRFWKLLHVSCPTTPDHPSQGLPNKAEAFTDKKRRHSIQRGGRRSNHCIT